MKNMAQALSWYSASYQPAMDATFCFPISILVSEKEVKVPPTNIAFHFCMRSAASYPAKEKRSVNKNIFWSSPTLSGSSVWNVSAITMAATAWGVYGRGKRRLSAVRRQAASIAA